jgi:hypothetical protein
MEGWESYKAIRRRRTKQSIKKESREEVKNETEIIQESVDSQVDDDTLNK